MSNWRTAAQSAIALALKDLPPDADKKKAIDAAYPFVRSRPSPLQNLVG